MLVVFFVLVGEENYNNQRFELLSKKFLDLLIKRYDNLIEHRQDFIDHELNKLQKKIDQMKDKERISSDGYDLIYLNIKSLKFNLKSL